MATATLDRHDEIIAAAKDTIPLDADNNERVIVTQALDMYEPRDPQLVRKGASSGIIMALQNAHRRLGQGEVSVQSDYFGRLRWLMSEALINGAMVVGLVDSVD